MGLNKEGQQKILSGILVLVIGGLVLALLTGIFSLPKPIRVVQDNDEVCPNLLNFGYNEIDSFEIKLRNSGKEGGLFVSLYSNEVMVRSKDREEFGNLSRRDWNVPEDAYQDFEFDISIEDEPEKVSIEVIYGCNGFLCSSSSFCCNYNLTRNKNYEFINESITC